LFNIDPIDRAGEIIADGAELLSRGCRIEAPHLPRRHSLSNRAGHAAA
jgi:hypothetical protein